MDFAYPAESKRTNQFEPRRESVWEELLQTFDTTENINPPTEDFLS